jgi:hypothetical protein
MGEVPAALAAARTQAEASPDNSLTQTALGEAEYFAGHATETVTAFNHAAALDHCNPWGYYDIWRLQSLTPAHAAAMKQLTLAYEFGERSPLIQRTWAAVQQAHAFAAAPGSPTFTVSASPEEGFFRKRLVCQGIPIRSSLAAHDEALFLACRKVEALLSHLPDAAHRMQAAGSELHILAEREQTSDLPENRSFKNTPYIDAEGHATSMDRRTRGVGGLRTSCGEENLLGLPSDRYDDGSDICTHEFAHNLRNFGLTSAQRRALDRQYRTSLQAGLWKGAYAAVNPDEFFAEVTMWYFGSHGQWVPQKLTTPGAEALRAYDPGTYAALEALYGPPPGTIAR